MFPAVGVTVIVEHSWRYVTVMVADAVAPPLRFIVAVNARL